MIIQIISHTPTWVFFLLAALLALGASQLKTRTVSFTRVVVMPLAMLGLAVSGVVSAFGQSEAGLAAELSWLAGAALSGLALFARPVPEGTRFDATSRLFTIPGSAVPLLLILGIFCTKYAVGVTLGFHPELAHNSVFAISISGLYGVFSGVFAARAARLLRLAARDGSGALLV